MIFFEINGLDLEERVMLYRKCIDIVLSKDFDINTDYELFGVEISSQDFLKVARYAIEAYGNITEKTCFYKKFGVNTDMLDENTIDSMRHDRLNYIYDFKMQYGNEHEKSKEFAKKMGISMVDIPMLAKDYALGYLRLPLDEYNWMVYVNAMSKFRQITAKLSYKVLFDLLLGCDSDNDVIYLIEYSAHNFRYIFNKIPDYLAVYFKDKSEEEKNQIAQELKRKLLIYKKYIVNKNIEKEKKDNDGETNGEKELRVRIEVVQNLVSDYINCDKTFGTIAAYCEYYGIDANLFKEEKLQILAKHRKELYQLYHETVARNRVNGTDDVNEIAKITSDYILNGVPMEDGVRKFDLIDYYSLTDYYLLQVSRTATKFLSRSEYREVAKFFAHGHTIINKNLDSTSVFVNDYEYDCDKDEQGFPIEGTGKKVTDEEKMEIVRVFKKHNIPLAIYRIAFERIKNGIPIDDVVADKIKGFEPKTRRRRR